MQHLSTETLARLVDEVPASAEARHLEACAACRAELAGLQAQTENLRGLPELEPPAGGWSALEVRLAEEGLVRDGEPAIAGGSSTPLSQRRSRWSRQLPRLAAGLALFLAGGVAGAAVTGSSADGGPSLAGEVAGENGSAIETAPSPVTTRTVADASESLRDAEAAYLAALSRYAELTGSPRSVDAATRLATLESIVLTTRAALDEAPADPVINGYHLTALGQRNAMLRQIARQSQDPWF